jgi:hypothetical protein
MSRNKSAENRLFRFDCRFFLRRDGVSHDLADVRFRETASALYQALSATA